MEDKKDKKRESRSERMYKNSPRIEKGPDGKVGMTTAQKEQAEVNGGTDGIGQHESHDQDLKEMLHRHAEARLKMHHDHEEEHMKHAHKMMKEKTGKDLIEKIEQDKKGEE